MPQEVQAPSVRLASESGGVEGSLSETDHILFEVVVYDCRPNVPRHWCGDEMRPPSSQWVVLPVPPVLGTLGGAMVECQGPSVRALKHG